MSLARLLCPPCMAIAFEQQENVAEVCGLQNTVTDHVSTLFPESNIAGSHDC